MQLVLLGFEVVEELADAVDFLAAFENQLLLFFGEVAEGDIKADAAGGFDAEVIQPFLAFGLGPGFDGAFVQGEAAIDQGAGAKLPPITFRALPLLGKRPKRLVGRGGLEPPTR